MRPGHALTLLAAIVLLAACARPDVDSRQVSTPSPTATLPPEPAPVPTPAPSMATAALNVYEDPVGSLRFLFEVKNLNRYPVERIRATIRLRDGNGRPMAAQSAYARMDLLDPGESVPVLVVFFLASPEFARYDIEVEAHRADYIHELLHPSLEVIDLSGRVGQWVPYEVLGRVLNSGDHDAESVAITASCFDSEGRMAAIVSGKPERRLIPAGESSEFLLSVGSLAGSIVDCRAYAEGLIADYQYKPSRISRPLRTMAEAYSGCLPACPSSAGRLLS